jgi:small subunit ribosomal protein S5e
MAAQTYACEVKLFNKWSYDDISVGDISLEDYIAVKPKFAQFVPHTAGRFQAKRFKKAQCPIVERMTCSLMMHGRNNGKKIMAVRIVQHAFDIVNLLTDQNPIQQLVDAIINASPREDSTRVGSGGVVRRQAVDVSPMRRVNQAIYLITQGARAAAFRNIKTIAEVSCCEEHNTGGRGVQLGTGLGAGNAESESRDVRRQGRGRYCRVLCTSVLLQCLADEIINAAKGSSNSFAIKKKDELERIAKANR